MPRRRGDTHLALIQRRDQVKQGLIHQARLGEMAQVLHVSVDTIRRDVEAVFEEWRKDVAVKQLWSHKAAFDRISELDRQYWAIFHQTPRQLPFGKHMILEDRSRIKVEILDSLVNTVRLRNIMRGIGTVKVFEQLRYIESETARGFEITRISAEDRMKADVANLHKDLERQRREGLIRDSPATTT